MQLHAKDSERAYRRKEELVELRPPAVDVVQSRKREYHFERLVAQEINGATPGSFEYATGEASYKKEEGYSNEGQAGRLRRHQQARSRYDRRSAVALGYPARSRTSCRAAFTTFW